MDLTLYLSSLILVAIVAHNHAYKLGYRKGYRVGQIEGKLQEFREANGKEYKGE